MEPSLLARLLDSAAGDDRALLTEAELALATQLAPALVQTIQQCTKRFAASRTACTVAVRAVQRGYELVAQGAPLPQLAIERLHVQTQTALSTAVQVRGASGACFLLGADCIRVDQRGGNLAPDSIALLPTSLMQQDAVRLSSYLFGHRLWQLCRQSPPPALRAALDARPFVPHPLEAATLFPLPATGHTIEVARLALSVFLSYTSSLCAQGAASPYAESLLLQRAAPWAAVMVRLVRSMPPPAVASPAPGGASAGSTSTPAGPAIAVAAPATKSGGGGAPLKAIAGAAVDPAVAAAAALATAQQCQQAGFQLLWRAAGAPATSRPDALSLRLTACEWLCATSACCPVDDGAELTAAAPVASGGPGAPMWSAPQLLQHVLSASRRCVSEYVNAAVAAASSAAATGSVPPGSDSEVSALQQQRRGGPLSVAVERCAGLLAAIQKAFPQHRGGGSSSSSSSSTVTSHTGGAATGGAVSPPAAVSRVWSDAPTADSFHAWLGWYAAVCRKAGQYGAAYSVEDCGCGCCCCCPHSPLFSLTCSSRAGGGGCRCGLPLRRHDGRAVRAVWP